jgi:hypothetical protein
MSMITNFISCSDKEGKQGKTFDNFSVYLGSKGNQLCALKIYSPSLSKEEAFKR